PAGHAGVDVAGEDTHRPLVVAGTHDRVPGAGIGGTVVHQVRVQVRRPPAPHGAAALLPLVAALLALASLLVVGAKSLLVPVTLGAPGPQRRVLAHRLAQRHGPVRIHQDVRIGTRAERTPGQLAVLDVEGGNPATHAELGTGTTREGL